MHGRWGVGGQYLLELGVGSISHKLQNEPFAGGEEGTALPHAGQRHQPVHLAAGGGRLSVHSLDIQTAGKISKDPTPWFFMGFPFTPDMHPPIERPAHLREVQASTTTWTCSPWSSRSKVVFWGQREVRADPRQ